MEWAGLKSRDSTYRQLKNDLKSITSVQITAESFKEYFESFYTTHLATEAEITKYTCASPFQKKSATSSPSITS